MAVFDELDWRRLDVHAIVAGAGVATIALEDHERYRAWLASEGFDFDVIDCSRGYGAAVEAFGRLVNWQEQFGYALTLENHNLNALRDGFAFDVPMRGGRVLEMTRPDIAWADDSLSMSGWLAIASEYSRSQMALGRRFFTALVVPLPTEMVGGVLDLVTVPFPWDP